MENDTSGDDQRKSRGVLFRFSSAIDGFMRSTFFRLGYFVAGNPLKTIISSFIVVSLCLIGMLRFQTESRESKLWVPQGTIALKNQDYVEDNYGQTVRVSGIAYTSKEGASLASKSAFLEMLNVAEEGFSLRVEGIQGESGDDGNEISFAKSCLQTRDQLGNVLCLTKSAFELFYDTKFIEKKDGKVDFFKSVKNKINSLTDSDIRKTLENPPSLSPLDGSPFNSEEIIGGKSGTGATFIVNVLLYNQFSKNNAITENGEQVDKQADKLEEKWTNLLLEETDLLDSTTEIDWKLQSDWSRGDSLAQALTGDLPLLSIGFIFLGVYVVLFLGDFHAIRSHMLLGSCALLTTGLSLGVCFGLSSALGMFFGPVHQILPLLIIGIGIDDCFHVTRAADDVFLRKDLAEKPLRLKIALALSTSGSAITVTSFTNIVVFLLSAISDLPALRFFALWAAIGIFAAWALSVTFFAACLTLDYRRSEAKRRDCCPCFPPVKEVKELNWFKKPAGGFSRFFANQFGPFILHPIVRVVLLVLLVAWLAVCCWGVSRLYLKFQFAFFFPNGSAQREYQDIIDANFKLGDPSNVYIRDADLSTKENQLKLLEICKSETGSIAKNEWVQGDTVNCWYEAFRQTMGVQGDQETFPKETFVQNVQSFLNSSGGQYANDLVFEQNKILGCRFGFQYVYRETNQDEVDALQSVRETAEKGGFGVAQDGTPNAFPYVFFDTFTEQYAALPREIGLSLGLASAAVALVCIVLIGNPIVAIISVIVVGIIIIDVLGITNFSGINLNSVSVITLVLCTGISVDFVVHIMRSFLEHVGSRKERAIKALETMGPPVFYAGFSTFLAIIVLAGAKSYIFKVIFQGFLFLILMGFIHGLVFGPILLSLFGPPGFYSSEEEKQNVEKRLEEKISGQLRSTDAVESA